MTIAEELTDDQIGRLVGIGRVKVRGRWEEPATQATVRGYIRKGYRPADYDGPPVFLKAVLIGQDYCTLPEWVAEFERERARVGVLARRKPAAPPPSRKARAEHRRAERRLDQMGCK